MDVQGWVVVGLALVLFGYLVPHLAYSRHQLAQARVEDRFSGTLRVVTTGATVRRSSAGEHHGTHPGRPYLHDPRRRTEAPPVNRPTTPSERAAAEARRLAQLRAARAAEIGRRQAAAKRRLVLTVLLLTASVGGWLAFGLGSLSVALGVVPTVLLATVLVLGRRAAKIAARRNAADRALMARLDLRPGPRTRPAPGRAPETSSSTAAPAAATDVEAAVAESPAAPAAEPATEPSIDAPEERGWTPVPVPAPSYTLKAAAPRRDIAPYEAPEPQPVEAPAAPAQAPAVPAVSGLAGSPYAPVFDPESAEIPAPEAAPARGLDLDSVLARRRAASA